MSGKNSRKDIFYRIQKIIYLNDGEDTEDFSLIEVHDRIFQWLSTIINPANSNGSSRVSNQWILFVRYVLEDPNHLRLGNTDLTGDRIAYSVTNYDLGNNRHIDYEVSLDENKILMCKFKGFENDACCIEKSIKFGDTEEHNCNVEKCGYQQREEIESTIDNICNNIRSTIIQGSTDFTDQDVFNIISKIPKISDNEGSFDLFYAPFFSYAFECVCRSVLSGEYAMDDGFSQRVRTLAQKLRNSTLIQESKESKENGEPENLRSWLNYLSKCIVTLSQILDEYNLFCIQIDAQVDKEPSFVLRKTEEYYNRHEYVDRLYDFIAGSGFLCVNPMLLHFFQSFLEMARIDQNFYFSTANFASLMYLRELLKDDGTLVDKRGNGSQIVDGNAKSRKKEGKQGKGLVQVWKKCQKDSLIYFKDVQEVLKLARLKNDILLRKMWEGCYEELKDLTYVGQDKVLIFDPRKCREKEVGEEYHTELLLSTELFDKDNGDDKKGRVPEELLNMTKALVEKSYFNNGNENFKKFEEYETNYIKAKWEKEKEALELTKSYYDNLMISQTSHTSLDIRHYNSKVIEMSRNAVFYTADFRIWIKHHKYDYDEATAFPQIHKVLLFLQNRYSEGEVCYDNEMLEGYAMWCIEFLNIVSKKAPEPDSNRPFQIEETLLLLETINSLLDRLVVSILKGNYCLPFASKFRGCFFKYNEQKNKSILERVFVDGTNDAGYTKEDFEPFISAGTSEREWMENKIENREDILFLASSFVPPFNLERLKYLRTKFKRDTHKLRNEIHAEYFNRLREYVKEDSLKQLEENRRSVVQILGIFAAFLALTTVALGASTANQSDLPFMTIMIGFTCCIAVFVVLLYFITYTNIRRNIERQYIKDNITNNRIYEEVSSVIERNKEDEDITKEKIEKDFAVMKKMISEECKKTNKKFQLESDDVESLKKKIETQIAETEQEQKNKIDKVLKSIPNEVDNKIKEYRKKQNCAETCKLWGPSIIIAVALLTSTMFLHKCKNEPVEKSERKEIKIDIKADNTVESKKENVTHNMVHNGLIFPFADNNSTIPLENTPF